MLGGERVIAGAAPPLSAVEEGRGLAGERLAAGDLAGEPELAGRRVGVCCAATAAARARLAAVPCIKRDVDADGADGGDFGVGWACEVWGLGMEWRGTRAAACDVELADAEAKLLRGLALARLLAVGFDGLPELPRLPRLPRLPALPPVRCESTGAAPVLPPVRWPWSPPVPVPPVRWGWTGWALAGRRGWESGPVCDVLSGLSGPVCEDLSLGIDCFGLSARAGDAVGLWALSLSLSVFFGSSFGCLAVRAWFSFGAGFFATVAVATFGLPTARFAGSPLGLALSTSADGTRMTSGACSSGSGLGSGVWAGAGASGSRSGLLLVGSAAGRGAAGARGDAESSESTPLPPSPHPLRRRPELELGRRWAALASRFAAIWNRETRDATWCERCGLGW